MSYVDELVASYRRFVALPWQQGVAPPQRVWMAVYPPQHERRVRLNVREFENATMQAGHGWALVDITTSFERWMAGHEYAEAYFEEPELLDDPVPMAALSGDEPLKGIKPKRTVGDFWSWAYSDLSANTRRGHLAEFIVATALNVDRPRVEWDSFDLITADNVKVEVKSAAYIQAWRQSQPSVIKFGSMWLRAWEPIEGYQRESALHADVYVFALQACQDSSIHDALDVDQWRFYVASRGDIRAHLKPTSSPSLSALRRFARGPVDYDGLRRAVAQVVARS